MNIKNTYIGMEFDDCEIRAIEVDTTNQIPIISSFSNIDLEKDTIVNGTVKDAQALGEKMRQLVDNSSFKSDKVILGISSNDVLIRFTTVPDLQDNMIRNMIQYQSEDFFPVSITDYAIDFMTLDLKEKTPTEKQKDIVVVAAKNSLINAYTAALDIAKLHPYEIDVCVLSLMGYSDYDETGTGAVKNNFKDDLYETIMESVNIIANIAYGKIELLITKNFVPIFAKTSFFNCDILNKPDNESEDDDAAFQSLLEQITSEIKAVVNYCFSLKDTENPSKIMLCGPVCTTNGLVDYIAKQTQIRTIVIYPQGQALNSTAKYSAAINLALRGGEL